MRDAAQIRALRLPRVFEAAAAASIRPRAMPRVYAPAFRINESRLTSR